jgi:hypothetical protein
MRGSMLRALRLARIVHAIGRYGLDEFLTGRGSRAIRLGFSIAYFWRDRSRPRAGACAWHSSPWGRSS